MLSKSRIYAIFAFFYFSSAFNGKITHFTIKLEGIQMDEHVSC
jgi:hypothetical protein